MNIELALTVHRLQKWEKKVVLLVLHFKFKDDIFTLQSAWVMDDDRTNSTFFLNLVCDLLQISPSLPACNNFWLPYEQDYLF